MALPLYALTLFVSAFILFLVQPIVGKIILPKLGGTPQVWNTCMVFFQMALLAGYAYTHNASTRLTLRQQLMAHAALLCLPLIVLLPFPFAFGGGDLVDGVPTNKLSLWGFVPDLGSNPIPSTLGILFLYVALPFLVVATTSPLLQKWFVHTGHPSARDPYFLSIASNFGSMLSLILYPILIEPYVSLTDQGWIYVAGYIGLIAFVMACAALVWNSKEVIYSKPAHEPKPEPAPAAAQTTAAAGAQTGISAGAPTAHAGTTVKAGQPGKGKGAQRSSVAIVDAPVHFASDEMTFGRRFRWVMLAAVPSSLMLGITTHITTDLSPQPMFWLIPLILYLLSFILVFARWPVVWTDQPHNLFLYAQPFCICFMIMADVWNLASDPQLLKVAIFAHVLGFFASTMMCHGELAKDRPSTKYLTEFYLWMSVGGMVGGIFNALIAPVIFWKYFEFPLAIFAAALVRPKMFETGLGDNFLASLFESQPDAAPAAKGGKGAKQHHHAPGMVTANESLVRNLDFAWPVVILLGTVLLSLMLHGHGATVQDKMFNYGLPLALACVCLTRPLRFGLGVGAVLLLFNVFSANLESSTTLVSSRSYFGAISVKQYGAVRKVDGKETDFRYRQLIHGHIDHGMNFVPPKDLTLRGDWQMDLSRLATTYYHREGPAGRVMEKFNWHSQGKPNTFHADARLPASVVGNVFADLGSFGIPAASLVSAWSEPPFCTIGLGTGTMASYGRPYQHVHFYEIDDQIQRLSLRTDTRKIQNWEQYKSKYRAEPPFFNYLEQAIERGCAVQVFMGDARLRMALPYKNHYLDETDRCGGPDNFYHMMVVDAFSSDAIPAHLLTKQAFQMYFTKLTEEGILCVHTSNRFVDLPKVVSAVADNLGYVHLRGHDINDNRSDGHYTSEWVMVAKKQEYLKRLSGDTDFLRAYKQAIGRKGRNDTYWESVDINPRYVWTDDYYNLLSVVRWR
ncbi:MAG: hypothetical protein EXR98_08380 [Gemmataceae bacterium]|nr:hypothetical protein [Gemmataceae bacterium]